MFKHTLPSFIRLMMPFVTWKVKTNDKVVYLTFDDGPHPSITPQVLNMLSQYHAKATFFCVGDNVIRYPEVIEQIKQQGHRLGNHTMHHQSGWKLNTQKYINEVMACAQVLPSTLFRPPYGRIKPNQALALTKRGFSIIMWDILTCDYEANLNIHKALNACKKLITNGSVIVMHDSEKAKHNMEKLLPELLLWLHQNNYSCKAL